MPKSLLEPDYLDGYNEWKTTPSPATNAKFLTQLSPIIEGAIRTHVGEPNPILLGEGKLLALSSLPKYDPMQSRLSTYLYNQLQGLKRIGRNQTQILRVPERLQFGKKQIERLESELEHEFGRPPSDGELLDRSGLSAKQLRRLREFNYALPESALENPETGESYSGSARMLGLTPRRVWQDIVYDELDNYHRTVMEYTLGLNGKKPLSNNELAIKLKRTPGAISQAKFRIQKKLDQEAELSPFKI